MAKLTLFTTFIAVMLSSLLAMSQGPNTLAPYNPNSRTFSINATWFIVPISSSAVAKAVKKYPLAPVPRHNKTLFPAGFPADKHPVLVAVGYENDIRRGNLEIDALMTGMVIAPFVDRLGDGTPFNYPLATYIGGANGQSLMGVVPALVGSANSQPIQLATFTPNTAPYASTSATTFSAAVKKQILPNPVSGPQIAPAAIDLAFTTAHRNQLYTSRTFHSLINQPAILPDSLGKKCQRNTVYFNMSFTDPVMRVGRVVLYSKGGVPKSVAGVFGGVRGYSANGVEVGFAPQDCKEAAAMNDREAGM